MTAQRHPQTDFHYIHIFKPVSVFAETRACYALAAKRLGWMSVDDGLEWNRDRAEWRDPEVMLIFWGFLPEVPEGRSAALGIRYTESIGSPSDLIENQRAEQERLVALSGKLDIVFTGAPSNLCFIDKFCRRTALMPAGYEAAVMGMPDWSASKKHDLAVYGTEAGRRQWIMPALRQRFGERLLDIQAYGAGRKAALDTCRAVLYVGHSSEAAFPGMRLWQAISSSAALITERRDAWPAVPGKHFLEVEPAVQGNSDLFVDAVDRELAGKDLRAVAVDAHDHLSEYTAERCMEEYLVPATISLRNAGVRADG